MSMLPPDEPCPKCGEPMPPMMPSGGYAPPGFEPEYDHWFCTPCGEVVMFDERPLTNDEVRRQLGPTGKEKTR